MLEVIYLVFNEGYAATSGRGLGAAGAVPGGDAAGPHPRRADAGESEVHGLVALMEIQASRLRARVERDGEPVLLPDQDRGRWDRVLIGRGLAALERAEQLRRGARPVRAAGRDRRLPRPRAHASRRPTGRGSPRSTRRSPS